MDQVTRIPTDIEESDSIQNAVKISDFMELVVSCNEEFEGILK
jgi:hypothetical protein